MKSTYLENYERKLVKRGEIRGKRRAIMKEKFIASRKNSLKIAQKMKENNIPPETILKCTGVRIE